MLLSEQSVCPFAWCPQSVLHSERDITITRSWTHASHGAGHTFQAEWDIRFTRSGTHVSSGVRNFTRSWTHASNGVGHTLHTEWGIRFARSGAYASHGVGHKFRTEWDIRLARGGTYVSHGVGYTLPTEWDIRFTRSETYVHTKWDIASPGHMIRTHSCVEGRGVDEVRHREKCFNTWRKHCAQRVALGSRSRYSKFQWIDVSGWRGAYSFILLHCMYLKNFKRKVRFNASFLNCFSSQLDWKSSR
jgi:hypothetical protein